MRRIFFLAAVLSLSSAASAQWTSNTLVNTEVSSTSTGDCVSATTSDGQTWLAWFKNVGSPNNFEMRAQLLDKNGNRMLGPEGVLVNNATHPTFTTVFSIIVDNSDNLIIGFANASTNTVFINKINTSGAQVWSSNVSFTNGLLPKFCVLGNNDIIVSWLNATGTLAPMQKLSASTGATMWTSPVSIQPLNAAHRTTPGHILPLSGNNFLYVFHNRTGTTGTASTLWVQRYDANGNAQWAAPVQLCTVTTAYNTNYWPQMHNDTLFLGYTGATGLQINAFVQRVNPDGTTPWGMNGSDFATDATKYETSAPIVVIPATNSVWATSRITNTSQGMVGTYVQKFDKSSGARQFTDNGKVIYNIATTSSVAPSGISVFSDNSPLLLLTLNNNATNQYLYASKLDAAGNFMWAGDTVALARFQISKLRTTLNRVINDQAVATFVERKGAFDQPYAQPIRINGTTGLSPAVAAFNSNITKVCRGNTIQFNSTSTGSISNYAWSFPGGTPSTSTSPNPAVTYPTNGSYDVSLTVDNAAGTNTIVKTNYITVTGITANAGPDQSILEGDEAKLTGSADNTATSIAWTPAATLTNANTFTPVTKPPVTTVYTLTVTSADNCIGANNVIVTVIPYCVKVMKAFTPNGDGMNDKWLATSGSGCTSKVSVGVYNRYGGVIYKNDNYQNDWDGNYKGKPVADGTYYYVITYYLVNGKTFTQNGDVTILR